MTMRIDGGQPDENKTLYSMKQLTQMPKEILLSLFDTNASGTVSDKELTSKGFADKDQAELRKYMESVGIEKEVRMTKTGFTVEEFLEMSKEKLITIFDTNKSSTISDKEIAEKGLTGDNAAAVKAKVKDLGIKEKEKAVTRNEHRPKQVPLGYVPRWVKPPRDIRIPEETSDIIRDTKKLPCKRGSWNCDYNHGSSHEIELLGDRKEINISTGREKFTYSEYNSNGKLTFRYFATFNRYTDNTLYNKGESYCTYEYDDKGRPVRYVSYDEKGKPTRLDEYSYDKSGKAYRTIYRESELEELRPGQALPHQTPEPYDLADFEQHFWVIGGYYNDKEEDD